MVFYAEGRTFTVTVVWICMAGSGWVGKSVGCSPRDMGGGPGDRTESLGSTKDFPSANALSPPASSGFIRFLSLWPPEGRQGKKASTLFPVLSKGLVVFS